jgi:hypothetical protein
MDKGIGVGGVQFSSCWQYSFLVKGVAFFVWWFAGLRRDTARGIRDRRIHMEVLTSSRPGTGDLE